MNSDNRTFWEFFITHYRFTFIIVIGIILLGLFSVITIPKESNPEISVPFAMVTTVFPGAAARDVEELVTDVLEDKILTLDELQVVTSTSREGLSSIFVEFAASADTDKKIAELKEKVDEAEIDLPEEAEDPIVRKLRFSDQPILIFSLSGPFALPQLKQFAEDLKDEIESIAGVSRVDLSGGQEREIQVIVDKEKLDSFGVRIDQVTSAIQRANADIPTGFIETAGAKYTLRLGARLLEAKQVEKVPVTIRGNTPVFVEDVAEVIDGYSDKTTISRLSVNGSTPLPAITMQVSKITGGNIVQIGALVEEKIAQAQQEFLPENIEISTIFNTAEFIRDDLNTLARSGSQTVLLIIILLLLFLGWREALLASLAIPLTFLMSFIFLSAIGSTLNFLSIFALILSLGILIDSSIVIVESMHEYTAKGGKSPKEAAILTLRDFHTPLAAGTLTTLFAFAPMLLMSGILGEFIKHIPITLIIVLSSSLFVAFAIVPVIGMKWLRRRRSKEPTQAAFGDTSLNSIGFIQPTKRLGRLRERVQQFGDKTRLGRLPYRKIKKIHLGDRFGATYERLLVSLLESRKNKMIFVGILVLLFVLSLSLPVSGILKVNMFPSEDFEVFFIDVTKPIGTPLETTSRIVEPIEEILQADERVESFVVTIGSAAEVDLEGASQGSHLANFSVTLVDKKFREQRSSDIIAEFQRAFVNSVDADVFVTELASGPPTGAPVLVTITGKSLDTLEELANTIESFLKEIPGTRNVQNSSPESSGEFVLHIDRAKAQLHGVTTVEIAQLLRNAVSGTKATVIRKEGEEIDVVVKYALDPAKVRDGRTNIVDLSTLESLVIATPRGDVPLSSFTTSELKGARPRIQHEDGERVIRVSSLTEGGVTAIQIFQQLQEQMRGVPVPAGIQVQMGGERDDLQQSYNDMFRAMGIAVFLIAGLLVLQFRSYRQPLFVLAIIPLALIGVFPGLVLMGLPLSFPGIIGIVALVGIVVNDAIILVDKINKNRRIEMPTFEAVKNAGVARLQPIMLTSITTAVGIIPITLSAELWRSLGTSIIFGILFSTVLTLFVIPMLYLRFAEKKLD